MQDIDLNDFSDDADYAASMHQGSMSFMRSDSKRSSTSEPDGAEVVYLKDNVAIHPTQFASERITGRLKLTVQESSLSLSWIPYKGQCSNASLSERDRNLYTINSVPFTEVRSIRRHTPPFGWQYIIIVLSSGLAYPSLYFYNGGVREFLAIVKQHVFLAKSAEDANVLLVNDTLDPLQRTLSSLELPRAIAVADQLSSSSSFKDSPRPDDGVRTDGGTIFNGSVSIIHPNGRPKKKFQDPAKDLSIQVLEKFSLVTRFARETSNLLREGHRDGFGASSKRSNKQGPNNYPSLQPTKEEKVPDEIPMTSDPVEVDKLTLVWGKPRQPPLGPEEWSAFIDSEGRVRDSEALRKRIFYGGVDHRLRKKVWPIVLGYHSYTSTYAERKYLISAKKLEYEAIKNQWKSISLEQAKRFTKFRERKGLVEKDVVRTDRSLSFYEGDENPNVDLLRDILLTYSFYNFDLGYCQGMSDLLSPILFVMRDESETFWCFVALLERLGPNFNRDQNGVHSQLFAISKLVELLDNPLHNYFNENDCLNYFFCFRWVLIQFKREFDFEKILRLWEVLWTHYLSEHLHLYVCVAILKRYRNKIMGEQMDFDTLLKFINELSGHIDLDSILRDSEALCICAGENGAASIPPGTPPSLPVDDGLLYNQLDDEVL